MVTAEFIATAVLTGALLVSVGVALARFHDWRAYSPSLDGGGLAGTGPGREAEELPVGWLVGFFILLAVLGGGGLVVISGGIPDIPVLVVIMAAFGLSLLGFLIWGVYSSARFRGLHSAQATGASLLLVGLLVLAIIASKLVMG